MGQLYFYASGASVWFYFKLSAVILKFVKLLKSAGSERVNVFPCFSGTSNRTVASTNMNATSSRAHTVVTITFDQIIKNEMGSETKKSSVMNLVDLAGKTDGLCWLFGLYLNIPTI